MNERPVGLKIDAYPGEIMGPFITPGLDTDMRFIAPVRSSWLNPPRVGVLGWLRYRGETAKSGL
jgi:hypothetical protein